jgi:hypothetical protein
MKRTLISTVVTASLLITFDFSTLSAADLDSALPGDAKSTVSPPLEATQLIARGFRGGGGRRRGGFRSGGSRRGGGVRRGGGYRSSARGSRGNRSAGRSGGYRSARSGGARRATANRRSNNSHGQTGRSSAAHSKQGGRNGRHANNHNRSGRNDGRGGYGGWGAAWDAGDLVPVVDVTPYMPDVVPVVPDVTPVVVDPRPVVITLLNPAETHAPVNYNLGDTLYTLEAGQSAGHGDETQVITFDRGGSFGEARYTLAPGTYRFVNTDHGWELNTVTSAVAGDNTESTETTKTITKDANPFKLLNGG